jgi:hypothetical protein
MKNPLKIFLLGLLAYSACLTVNSQTPPCLSISNPSQNAVQVNWTNQVGTSYHVWFTTDLAAPFSSWPLLEDAFSDDSTVSIYASTTDTPIGFFRIEIPTNSSTPDVQIFAPADAQTVSGEISVRMGAQLGTQVQGVNLYLDDALVGYLNSGGMNFSLETTHFANGQHTVYVGAVDTANNETLSSPITLDFENQVRWLDACSMFNTFVPIDVDSDIYPADWLVSVADTNGTIVRTISGSTDDGVIQTSWDGTDDNSQPLPVENLYQITVDVTETSGSFMLSGSSMMMASSLASDSVATAVSSEVNSQGVPEFAVQQPAPNPLTAYEEMLAVYTNLTPPEKLIYPPLPPRPADNPNATTTKKLNAREMFLASHQTSGNATVAMNRMITATPNAGSEMRHGSTKDLVWYENPWSSGQTVLAYAGDLGFPQNGYVSSAMVSIRNLINTANDDLGGNRGVYQNTLYSLISAGDFSDLTIHLAETSPNNVRAFYFYGHGNTNGNAIGTLSQVVGAKTISRILRNYYTNNYFGKLGMTTFHAYSFVYLDGCNTGLGNFPEAFGIPKDVTGPQLNASGGLRKRAFMGWGAPVTHSWVGNYELGWSVKFWQSWLGDGYDSTIKLSDAVIAAENYHPGVTNDFKLTIYGNSDLTWGE